MESSTAGTGARKRKPAGKSIESGAVDDIDGDGDRRIACSMRRFFCAVRIRAVMGQRVLQPGFRREPDFHVTAHRPALLLPEEIGRMLDFVLGRFRRQESWFHDADMVAHRPAQNSAALGHCCAMFAKGLPPFPRLPLPGSEALATAPRHLGEPALARGAARRVDHPDESLAHRRDATELEDIAGEAAHAMRMEKPPVPEPGHAHSHHKPGRLAGQRLLRQAAPAIVESEAGAQWKRLVAT